MCSHETRGCPQHFQAMGERHMSLPRAREWQEMLLGWTESKCFVRVVIFSIFFSF